jgi:hypothetical protein
MQYKQKTVNKFQDESEIQYPKKIFEPSGVVLSHYIQIL